MFSRSVWKLMFEKSGIFHICCLCKPHVNCWGQNGLMIKTIILKSTNMVILFYHVCYAFYYRSLGYLTLATQDLDWETSLLTTFMTVRKEMMKMLHRHRYDFHRSLSLVHHKIAKLKQDMPNILNPNPPFSG